MKVQPSPGLTEQHPAMRSEWGYKSDTISFHSYTDINPRSAAPGSLENVFAQSKARYSLGDRAGNVGALVDYTNIVGKNERTRFGVTHAPSLGAGKQVQFTFFPFTSDSNGSEVSVYSNYNASRRVLATMQTNYNLSNKQVSFEASGEMKVHRALSTFLQTRGYGEVGEKFDLDSFVGVNYGF